MATVTFILQEPYKPGSRQEIKNRKAEGKSLRSLFNPKPTRIYLFFIYDRDHKLKIKTIHKAHAANWNFETNRPKQQSTEYAVIKPYLDELHDSVLNEYAELEKVGASWEQVKNHLKEFIAGNVSNIKLNEKDNLTLVEVYEKYMQSKASDIKPLTMRKYKTLYLALQKFEKQRGSVLYFDEITMQWYDDFKRFLMTNRKNKYDDTTGVFNETLAKYINNFKNFLRWSHERQYHSNVIYTNSSFSAKREVRNEIVTLTQDELRKLHTVDLGGNQRLERVRDLGVFLCHTLQRWGDIHNQRKGDIDIESRLWKFKAQKTSKDTVVRFIGYFEPAWNILKKYNYQLPRITDVEFNRMFKVVGRLAGIVDPVEIKRKQGGRIVTIQKPKYQFMSSHMGRRTGTSLLVNNGFPLTLLMKITGHTDVKTLMKYVRDDDELLVKALNEINIPILPKMRIAK